MLQHNAVVDDAGAAAIDVSAAAVVAGAAGVQAVDSAVTAIDGISALDAAVLAIVTAVDADVPAVVACVTVFNTASVEAFAAGIAAVVGFVADMVATASLLQLLFAAYVPITLWSIALELLLLVFKVQLLLLGFFNAGDAVVVDTTLLDCSFFCCCPFWFCCFL